MKKIAILLLLSTEIFSNAFAQNDPFRATEISWYGIDFSNARLIGSEGFTKPDDIKKRYFNAWNKLILKESDKYNLEKFFKKKVVAYDTIMVRARNASVNVDELVTNEEYSFGKDVVKDMVKSYDTDAKSGMGLVFIVESFNKLKGKSFVYVTFFDIATKEVLLTEKVKGEPGGFSLRNFWAASLLDVMDKSYGVLKKSTKK